MFLILGKQLNNLYLLLVSTSSWMFGEGIPYVEGIDHHP